MERVDSVCLTRSLAFSGTQAKMDSFLIALLEDFKKNSLTQKSAGTRTPNRALYTKKVYLYASDRLHFLSILYFSLCNRWIKLFAFPQEYLHLDTWIWTASRPEIQILIPLNGRGKGRRGMVKTASFYDAQALWEMIRCSAEHASHSSSSSWTHTWSGRVFLHSVVFISPDILANGSQHSHSWILTLHSCASAAAHSGSLHTWSPQPGLE